MLLRTAFAIGLLAVSLPAFAQEGGPPPPPLTAEELQPVTRKAVEDYILPAYGALGAAATQLEAAVDAACAAPGAETTATARQAFKDTVVAFAGVDFLRFGPMAEKGRYERFAYWPDRHGTGARQIRQLLAKPDPALLEPAAIARESAAIQGLPALEMLLFGSGDTVGGAAPAEAYRCKLAAAVAANLVAIAAETATEWTKPGGWRDLMERAGPDNPVYRAPIEPVNEILKAVLTGLEQVRDQRLKPALGAGPGSAKPGLAPYAKSGATAAYLAASGAALDDFVTRSGLLTLGPPNNTGWMAASAHFQFGNFKRAVTLDRPWADALKDEAGHKKLAYAIVVLRGLEELFQTEFPGAAGLSPGFNALDGD